VTRGMLTYIGQRLLLIAFTVFVVSFVVFLGIHSLPGNTFVNERVRGASLALLLHEYGLDRPVLVQYWDFISHAVQGNFGVSIVNRGEAITPIILRELSVSAELGGAALLITIGMGITFGVIAALRQNTWVDYSLTTFAIIGYSVPSFVIASVFVLVFGIWLFDVTGGTFYYPLSWDGTYGTVIELTIPAVALGLFTSSLVARITRASMLDVIHQDYVRTARAKGLKNRVVVVRHALRNALIPVTSVLGPLIISIITGSVVIENIFGIPGLGKEFIQSILSHDYNVTVAVFTMYALLVGVANLAVDLVYTVIDPRIRY
jgi:ABC-type dipeptide/oligopeptide/nickel transport system permease component